MHLGCFSVGTGISNSSPKRSALSPAVPKSELEWKWSHWLLSHNYRALHIVRCPKPAGKLKWMNMFCWKAFLSSEIASFCKIECDYLIPLNNRRRKMALIPWNGRYRRRNENTSFSEMYFFFCTHASTLVDGFKQGFTLVGC